MNMFLIVFVLSVSSHGEILPDDHGNSSSTATMLSSSSNAINGQIEFDTDEDHFSIPFYPLRSYVIEVYTGTVWDIAMTITPPGWMSPYVDTNTLRETPLGINWTNNGAYGVWQMAVEGMFNYTTGSYHLLVYESPFNQDADGDGMTDSWEMDQFGSTTNNPGDDYDGDGQSNEEEFFANTGSGVQVDWVDSDSSDDYVWWEQAAFSTYKIYSSTNLFGPWHYLDDSLTGDTGGTIIYTNSPGGDPIRFYRVEFIY